MNKRMQRAEQIMEMSNAVIVIQEGVYQVRSQSNPNSSYYVRSTELGLVCECLDHKTRKSDCKHIKVVLTYIKENKIDDSEAFKMIERNEVKLCRYCDSGNIKKNGIAKNKLRDIQMYKCRDCGKKFRDNLGFERMRYDPTFIIQSIRKLNSKMSTRSIADDFEQDDIEVSHMSVYNWLEKYSNLIFDYTNTITPRLSERWRTDELYTKFSGEGKWVYTMMDDSTRFMISQQISDKKYTENVRPMFKSAEKLAGMIPHTLISDGAPNFHDAWKSEWRQRNPDQKLTAHIRHIHIAKDMNNNKMERLNGTMRDWEQTRRGMKNMDSPMFKGFYIYYNFVKKHGGLQGKTPAEEALIHVVGQNKLLTLIQNASLEKSRNSN